MQTLIEETEPLGWVKFEAEYWKKIKVKMFFLLEILDYQDTDTREENNDFSLEYSSISAVFAIG